MLGQFGQIAAQNVGAAALWPRFEEAIVDAVSPELDKAIRLLARGHGMYTALKVRRRLKTPRELDLRIDELVSKLTSLAQMPPSART